ncbi:MAG: TatD family hydrolase [Betaproteobacteria bacterium]|nr:TatD family hydrolase [Betaproteobacteria bacterium]
MLIDTHCHIDAREFDADRSLVLSAARAASVLKIVVPAVERANFGAVASICREDPNCAAAFGIHPLCVGRSRTEDLSALREMLCAHPAVAVGEIGLDFYVEQRDEPLQEHFFVEQLKLARELDLPVILHVRRAVDAVLKQLRRIRVAGGIAHAFNGSRQQADEFIRLGFKLGFGGAMTFPRALRIRELAATLPLDAIVLETDAPDIPPLWLEGKRNQPAELPRIATTLAELRGLPMAMVVQATSANACTALPKLQSVQIGMA